MFLVALFIGNWLPSPKNGEAQSFRGFQKNDNCCMHEHSRSENALYIGIHLCIPNIKFNEHWSNRRRRRQAYAANS